MDLDYSIIVPAYNEADLLPRTLARLREAMAVAGGFAGELIVVDNNSTDASAELAVRSGARVVHEPINQISRARNCGARAAAGRYLVFVDADTLVPPALLQAALEALAHHAAVGGGTVVGTSEPTSAAVRRLLRLWNGLSRRFRWAAGAFVFCRRDAWQAVRGFSEALYAAEEIRFSQAIGRWGDARGLPFLILDIPVDTSMRKTRWYSAWSLCRQVTPLFICPWLLRSRRFCAHWYHRPPAK